MLIIRSASQVALESRLAAEISAHKKENPFAQDLIIVPRDAARRYLMLKLPKRLGRTALNLKVMTIFEYFYVFIREFGLPSKVSDPDTERFIVKASLDHAAEAIGLRLGNYREIEGLVYRVLRELLEAGLDESGARFILENMEEVLGRDAASTQEFDQLLLLFIVWMKARQQAGLYTPLDRIKDLTDRLRASTWSEPEAAVLHVYGFLQWSQLYDDFFTELFRRVGTIIYLPGTGNESENITSATRLINERLQRFYPRIEQLPEATGSTPSLLSFTASGCSDEIKETALRIRKLLDAGVEPSAIGVVVRRLEPYTDVIDEVFNRFGIPFWTTGRLSAGYEPLVRGIATTLECLATDFARAGVQDLLRMEQTALPERLRSYRYALDLVSKILGIERGMDWERLCDAGIVKDGVRIPFKTVVGNEEPDEDVQQGSEQVPGDVLKEFGQWILELRKISLEWPSLASWREHVTRLKTLLTAIHALSDEGHDRGDLGARISRMLESFISWDEHGFLVAREVFISFFRRRLFSLRPKSGGKNGVLVIDAEQASGMTFEYLFIAGLNRRKFPQQIRDDAVIADEFRRKLRERILPNLSTMEDKHGFERDLFQTLLWSATTQITLSALRSDDQGKPLSPSTFLQELINQDMVSRPAAISRNTKERLSKWRSAYSASALPPAELYEYVALAHGLSEYRRLVSPQCEAARLRFGLADCRLDPTYQVDLLPVFDETRKLTQLDGVTRDHPLLNSKMSAFLQGRFWATTLENLIGCPYRFYLNTILQIVSVEEPEPWTITVMDEGSIAHEILDEVSKRGGDSLTTKELATIADRVFNRFEERHRVGLQGLWRYRQKQILDYLATFLEWDRKNRLECGWRTALTEEQWYGSIIFRDGLTLKLGARIDRIDRTADPDNRAPKRLVDYKTAARPARFKHPADLLRTGVKIQPAVYFWLLESGSEGSLQEDSPRRVSGQAGLLYLKDQNPSMELTTDDWYEGENGYSYRTHCLRVMRLAIELLITGTPPFRTSNGCVYCPVAAACRRLEFAAKLRFEQAQNPHRDLLETLISTARTKLPELAEAVDVAYKELFDA